MTPFADDLRIAEEHLLDAVNQRVGASKLETRWNLCRYKDARFGLRQDLADLYRRNPFSIQL
jgi:hypothetical protein